MLLSKIALHNFSAFEGTQVLDLAYTGNPEHNITLIGAMNGAGKTSLLDAVKLFFWVSVSADSCLPKRSQPSLF